MKRSEPNAFTKVDFFVGLMDATIMRDIFIRPRGLLESCPFFKGFFYA